MCKKIWTILGLALTVSLSSLAIPAARATELPAGVLRYLKQKDPNVKVRFDGLVTFSSGETYVPIIPQDPTLNPEPQQVIISLPEKAAYPDLVEFDNHFFLLRLIQTSSGRLTFPKMTEYPLALKEGLLPQDFVMPGNLYIPVELKVILGALPYNPSYTPTKNPTAVPPAMTLNAPDAKASAPRPSLTQRVSYVFDITEQKVLGIDSTSGRRTGDIALDCAPSALRLSSDGQLLFAPCLSTNELVVADTSSNLVKTRIPVGQRPDAVLYLDKSRRVAVSNRYSPYVSLISATELVPPGQKITLPGNGGAMALIPGGQDERLAVSDAGKPQVYIVNATSGVVEKTVPTLQNVSALWAGPTELWVASRTQNQVQLIDPASGVALKTIDVGKKPVAFAGYGARLYVVCAGSDELIVIDRVNRTLLEPVKLLEDSFPSGIVSVPSQQRGYVITAGANNLVIVNLQTGQVENTLPVEFRASMIAMTPEAEPETEKLPAMPRELAGPPATLQTQKNASGKAIKNRNGKNAAKGDDSAAKSEKKAGKLNLPLLKRSPKVAMPLSVESLSDPDETKPASAQPAAPVSSLASPPSLGGGSQALPTQNAGKVTFKFGQGKGKGKPDSQAEQKAPAEAKPLAPETQPATTGGMPPMLEESISK